MEKSIVGLCGFKGSGKDETGKILAGLGYKREAYANSLKDICALLFNWNRHMLEGDTKASREWRETIDEWWAAKLNIADFSPRKAMQLVGTNSLRSILSDDIWVINLESKIANYEKVVVSDCRFPNEMELIKSMGGKIIWIQKDLPQWLDIAITVGNVIYEEFNGNRPKDSFKTLPEYNELNRLGIHESEYAWLGFPKDEIVENIGTLNELNTKVVRLF